MKRMIPHRAALALLAVAAASLLRSMLAMKRTGHGGYAGTITLGVRRS